ncbi:MAG: hypothetical protein EXR62_11340 [Chloroflexi bacterium]|nr:hypothetical protein [Chloroflexota bacterium]
MSGFVGLLNFAGGAVDQALLASLTRYLQRRGPDAVREYPEDTWVGGPAGLGHALLRTTHEAAAERQPYSLDGQVWIIADGRIDGRAELLAPLRRICRMWS